MPQPPRTFGQPDDRDDSHRLRDLTRVHRQVVTVLRTRDDAGLEDRMLARVRERRAARKDAVQFERIPARHGDRTLAVDQELLVRREALDDPRLTDLLTALQLRITDVDGPLNERVARLRGPHRSMRELAELATTLRRLGLPVSANYVTPMGGYIKSVAGPEPSSGAPPAFPKAQTPGRKKPPVRVAVIDTGFRPHGGAAPWLSNLRTTKDNADVLDSSPKDGYLDLASGHGTFCTGIVQQIAPGAEIVVHRAVASDGFADEVSVAQTIIRAAQEGLASGQHVIITLSLGTETADDERPVALGAAIEIVNDEALLAGREVLVVAAAGNYGRDRPCYPAALPTVTAVAAVTQALLPAEWSSRGAWVDVSTIGEGVRSTFVPGTESPLFDPVNDTFARDAWALWTGTSFAAPQVAGAIAKIALDDGVEPSEAKRRLLDGTPDVPLYGKRVEILPAIRPAGDAGAAAGTRKRRFRKA